MKYGVDDPWIVLDKPDCVEVTAAMSRRVRSRRVRKPMVLRNTIVVPVVTAKNVDDPALNLAKD